MRQKGADLHGEQGNKGEDGRRDAKFRPSWCIDGDLEEAFVVCVVQLGHQMPVQA